MSTATSAEVAEAVARHNVRNRRMTGTLTVSALLDELDRLHKIEEAALRKAARRWVCDADPSGVEHASFVGWTPCPSCRVIEPS